MAASALRLALLLSGQLPCQGRLLVDADWKGRDVAVDPGTAAEVNPLEGTWVLSDEGEATDGHIVRGEWNLQRADAGGINTLYDHGLDSSPIGSFPVGAWENFRTAKDIPKTVGRSLLAQIRWAEGIDHADTVHKLVSQKILRSASLRWIPGAAVRRGELDPDDPLYREPIDGMCGPEEGYVMGSPEHPNEPVEASLTPTPAQFRAYQRGMEARNQGSERAAAQGLVGGPVSEGDYSRLLARVAADPKATAWLSRLIDSRIRALQGSAPSPTPLPKSTTLGDLYKG